MFFKGWTWKVVDRVREDGRERIGHVDLDSHELTVARGESDEETIRRALEVKEHAEREAAPAVPAESLLSGLRFRPITHP